MAHKVFFGTLMKKIGVQPTHFQVSYGNIFGGFLRGSEEPPQVAYSRRNAELV